MIVPVLSDNKPRPLYGHNQLMKGEFPPTVPEDKTRPRYFRHNGNTYDVLAFPFYDGLWYHDGKVAIQPIGGIAVLVGDVV